ncbi:aldo/keto reductase [Pseudomonas sp. RL_15y_Pfl2_60]|uniref:aldo/keto reductase n=1 Tax=Pseudomonas sp. RL_15y_Pfl2_60 TaxID=3088709 RepID=UPI0030D8996C
MQSITTRQQLQLPKLGLGTWPMLDEECSRAVEQAIELGYRHIDTATGYNNEAAVGTALARSSTPREQIHVTTKVWWDKLQPQAMRQSLDNSLKALQSDYVDLFLIHWPGNGGKDWSLEQSIETLVELQQSGKAKHIGVANFTLPMLRRAVDELGAPLAALQVEYHLMLDQQPLLDFVRQHDMALTAYTPLARGKAAEAAQVQQVADKHAVLPSQVVLQWLLAQDNVAAIPKASGKANQLSNLQALDLRLDADDLALLAQLPKNLRVVNPDFAPQWDS